MVEAGGGHRLVVGDEEHELLVRVGPEDESLPVLGQLGILLEAEHVAVEGREGTPALGVEQVGRHRQGDVVEARRLGEVGSVHGRTSTFPASRPVGEAGHGVEEAVQGDDLGLDQLVDRDAARGQQGQGLLEAVLVVGEGPGDDQLVEQDAVRVEPRRLDAGTDEHQRAAPHQLGEARLHGRGLARALEHHVDGAVDHQARLGDGRHHQVVGSADGRGAHRPGQRLAALAGLGAGHVVDARAPAARRWSARRSARPPAPAPRWPGRTPDRVMPWSATASGSARAAARGRGPAGSGSSSSARVSL